ncbi:hypothetical protein [Calothrix sp. NIES-3974]|uniref:hypothetical protein n=1 Tax=Calothrix sp. NIES-3974 TaxID=2005462 RepID=UPI0012FD5C30|nr:hypothetical protein [Calothrix sp. NIES-3974]
MGAREFPTPNSRFPTPNSQLPIPDSPYCKMLAVVFYYLRFRIGGGYNQSKTGV